MNDEFEGLEIAVLIPCYNEEVAVPRVVRDFRQALPRAKIYVYDNESTDRTAQVAGPAPSSATNPSPAKAT